MMPTVPPTPQQPDSHSSRELASWIVGSRELEVFKADKRSKVWRITPAGMTRSLVIKRFEYGGFKQWVQHIFRSHPAQREARAAAALHKSEVPVVVPAGTGKAWDAEAVSIKYFIATPFMAPSLDRVMRGWKFTPFRAKIAIINAVGFTAARLVLAGYFFKDLKTSNIIVTDDNLARLIDTGCARRVGDAYAQMPRMLAMLDQTAKRDGASKADRLRCLKVICDALAAGKGGKKVDYKTLASLARG
jgi:tRNA A-37 threonylcarbamoyl transferase component Bud32